MVNVLGNAKIVFLADWVLSKVNATMEGDEFMCALMFLVLKKFDFQK